jgi:hypothetical protein
MNFLFKNKSVKPGSVNFDENAPLPGFLKTEPSFNMDYSLPPEQEPIMKENPHFAKPMHAQPPSFTPSYSEERKGPLTIHLSHSGMLGILFALLLLGVLFFMAGFLSGMMTTEYAARSSVSTPATKPSQTVIDSQGDDNV